MGMTVHISMTALYSDECKFILTYRQVIMALKRYEYQPQGKMTKTVRLKQDSGISVQNSSMG